MTTAWRVLEGILREAEAEGDEDDETLFGKDPRITDPRGETQGSAPSARHYRAGSGIGRTMTAAEKERQQQAARSVNRGDVDSPLMRPAAAAPPGTHAPTPSRLRSVARRPAPQQAPEPTARAAVPPSAVKTSPVQKEPTAAMDRYIDPNRRLPKTASGLRKKGQSQKSAWDDIRFSPEYQEYDPTTGKSGRGDVLGAQGIQRPQGGHIPSATGEVPASSPSEPKMPSATVGSMAKVRGSEKGMGRAVQGQSRLKVAPPGQAVLPTVTGAEPAQPKFKGTFHGQRWRPRGQSQDQLMSRMDQATGDWMRFKRPVAGEGPEWVWDKHAGEWVMDPEFKKRFPGKD